MVIQPVNVVSLNKITDRFIFRFDDANRDEVLRQIACLAANPQIDFNWFDAATVSNKIRKGYYDENEVSSVLLRK